MYIERKIDLFLREWKDNPDHKPLIVKGARQICKTVVWNCSIFLKEEENAKQEI